MDKLSMMAMVEVNSDIEPTDDTKAIWAKLVSSYGEDKAAAMLLGMADNFSKLCFEQMDKVSHLENDVAGLERNKGIKTYRSQVESGQVKPAQKCNTGQVEALYYKGLGVNEIASKLGISRTTVWRKLKDVKKLKEKAESILCNDEPKEVENKGKRIMTTKEIFGD